jgi:hypothetical protein
LSRIYTVLRSQDAIQGDAAPLEIAEEENYSQLFTFSLGKGSQSGRFWRLAKLAKGSLRSAVLARKKSVNRADRLHHRFAV